MKRSVSWLPELLILLAVVLLGASLWAVIYVLSDAVAKLSVALVGVASAIIVAFFKHTLDIDRRRKEAELLGKQENYKDLLAKIGDFARGKDGSTDALTSAHLASWAFGDRDVILSTNAFLKNRSSELLVDLLRAVRISLQHPDLEETFFQHYDAKSLFPPEVKRGLT